MNKVIRYAIKMKKGDYMVQDFDEDVSHRVLIHTVDNPIDSSFLKDKKVAERCIWDTISGTSNLVVIYDKDNPPEEVVELKINFEIN